MGFGKKPDNDATKYRRPARHKNLADKFGEDFCEMCLLKCSEFPPGDVLHAHHVDPYHEGGDATKDNLWMLCTCCHRLVEFQRRYRGQSIQAMRAKGAGDAS